MSQTYLGRGVYSLPEVASYTGTTVQRVRDWFKPGDAGKGTVFLRSDYSSVGRRQAVSFYDLIDVLVAARFREERLSLQTVREAYARLSDQLQTEHPFCRVEMYTDGNDIFAKATSSIKDDVLAEVISRQQFWFDVMKPYLRRIVYSETTQLAQSWNISRGVVIDPAIGFGKPVAKGSSTSTSVLANAYFANERDAGVVAEHFGLSATAVMDAVRFEQKFGRKRNFTAA